MIKEKREYICILLKTKYLIKQNGIFYYKIQD